MKVSPHSRPGCGTNTPVDLVRGRPCRSCTTLRAYASGHRYGNATIAQFIAITERLTHRNLNTFFHTWLWENSKLATLPSATPR